MYGAMIPFDATLQSFDDFQTKEHPVPSSREIPLDVYNAGALINLY
jgi:hypothetical protein